MALISSGVVKGRICPICGTANHACGLPYGGNPLSTPEARIVANTHDLFIYQDANGNTFQMTEADGEAAGYTRATREPTLQADEAREAAGGAEASDPDSKARAAASNKARQQDQTK